MPISEGDYPVEALWRGNHEPRSGTIKGERWGEIIPDVTEWKTACFGTCGKFLENQLKNYMRQ